MQMYSRYLHNRIETARTPLPPPPPHSDTSRSHATVVAAARLGARPVRGLRPAGQGLHTRLPQPGAVVRAERPAVRRRLHGWPAVQAEDALHWRARHSGRAQSGLPGDAVRHPDRLRVAAGARRRAAGAPGADADVAAEWRRVQEELQLPAGARSGVAAAEERAVVADGEAGVLAAGQPDGGLGQIDRSGPQEFAADVRRQEEVGLVA